MIHLTTTKETFIKNLVKMGYNYKIKQYDDFIATIRRIISSQIDTAIQTTTLKEKVEQIFGYEVSLLIIEDKNKIEKIKISFLTNLIESGLLDLYLVENNRIVSKEVQEKAYFKTLINELDQSSYYVRWNLKEKYKKLFDKQSSQYLSIKKCMDHNQILISDEKKEQIQRNLNIEIAEDMIQRERHKISLLVSNTGIAFLGKYDINVGKLKDMIKYQLVDENILTKDLSPINLKQNLLPSFRHVDSLLMKLNKRTGLSKINILKILRAIKDDDTSLLKDMKIFKDKRVEKNIWNTLKKQEKKVYDGFKEYETRIEEYEVPTISDVILEFQYEDTIVKLDPEDYFFESDLA